MDAVVGHRSPRYEQFGWAAARLDDAAGWVPARLTAALVAAVRPRAAKTIWRTVRADAGAHPSPNSGVAEAAFAAALGLRLGGTNQYGSRVEVRPYLGEGRPPEAGDIASAVRLSRDVTYALAASLGVLAVRS
jgi:adenosylcobinamide-phosphate synthase